MPVERSFSLPLCRNLTIDSSRFPSILGLLFFSAVMEERYGDGKVVVWRAILQRNYLSRLLLALRHRRIGRSIRASAQIRSVKLAADLSLAMTSGDRTAWNRAILGKHLSRLQKSHYKLRVVKARGNLYVIKRLASAKSGTNKRTSVCKKFARPLFRRALGRGYNCREAGGGAVASRMQTLRLLVPGSRGLDTPDLLKQTTDYIAVLKKRVQVMNALVECCSN